MTNSIYIAVTEPYTGKSVVALGITELLLRRTSRVGIFRPVIGDWKPGQRDKTIDLLLRHFNLPIEYDATHAFHRTAAAFDQQGGTGAFMDQIITKFKELEARCDFVLCIGSDFEGEGTAFEFDLSAEIARNLGAPVLVVSSAATATFPPSSTRSTPPKRPSPRAAARSWAPLSTGWIPRAPKT
ncbi:MAG: AAA family ATPase [Caldilineaceae bacterium]